MSLLRAFAASTLLVAARAHAEEGSRAALAQGLFDDAKSLMDQGRATEACPKFEESQRLDPGSGTLINLALCYEKVGRLASAWTTYLEAAAAAHATSNFERENGAREYAYRLSPRVSRLRVDVPDSVRVPSLRVQRDGIEIGPAQWGVDLPADDGTHTIRATAPGRVEWKTQVRVVGPHASVAVAVPRLSEQKGNDASPPVAGPSSAALGPQRVAAIVAGAAGAAGVVVSGIFGAIALSKKNQANCEGSQCETTEDVRTAEAAHSAGNVATVAAIVGGVGLAGGLVLWFTAPARERIAVSHVQLLPNGVRVGGVF